MKHIINSLFIYFIFYISSCSPSISQTTQQAERKFLYKTEYDTSTLNKGQHIEVKQVLPDIKELIPMSIDDRDIIGRSKYSRDEQIIILSEYLTFQGDTNTSNKKYHFKAAYHMQEPEGILGFTIEVEALYSFTRMLTVGYPPIKPVLINRTTGEQLNTNPMVVREVYNIYKEWYKKNRETDFKNIKMPLTGSPYIWEGEDIGMELYLKKSF